METIDYQKQAQDFLEKTGVTFKAEFLEFGKYFEDDKHARLIFKITLEKGSRKYSFNFGTSLKTTEDFFIYLIDKTTYWDYMDWKKHFKYPARVIKDEEVLKHLIPLISKHKEKINAPSAYDVLACLTKYDPDTFEEFCYSYGYDTDSRKAEKIYKAVCEEWVNVQKIWTDSEIEEMQEIQ